MVELFGERLDETGRHARPRARHAVAARSPPPSNPLDWRGSLGRVIETEILPRLLLAHRGADSRESLVAREGEGELDLTTFVELLVAPQADRAREYVEKLGRANCPESVLLDTLAPAARCLGQLWEVDQCDFVEVTVGLRRLHDALRVLIPDFDDIQPEVEGTGHALFLPAQGETHVFGLTMLDRFFRRAGWRTRLTETAGHLDHLRREWFDIAGFSLSCDRYLAPLAEAVSNARSASLNNSIFVLVGGPIFAERPELCRQVGADATARDGPSAVQLARALLERRARL
jgi:methanogenic corrinoid protein MtbC1